jgi:co-chaperonin GroES (HSP10)
MIETASNKIVELPGPPLAVGRGIIVQVTDKFCKSKTDAGLLLSTNAAASGTKFDIGEVVSVGSAVVEVKKGDVVIYQIAGSFQIPNGIAQAIYTKIEETAMSIMCIMPREVQGDLPLSQ